MASTDRLVPRLTLCKTVASEDQPGTCWGREGPADHCRALGLGWTYLQMSEGVLVFLYVVLEGISKIKIIIEFTISKEGTAQYKTFSLWATCYAPLHMQMLFY